MAELSTEQRQEAHATFEQLTLEGASADVIGQAKGELQTRFGCSAPQLSGIQAHIVFDVNRELRERGLYSKGRGAQVLHLRHSVEQIDSRKKREQEIQRQAELMGLPENIVRTLLIKTVQKMKVTLRPSNGRSTGAHINYAASEIKQLWQMVQHDCLLQHIPRDQRSDCTVIGLFGAQCESEVEPIVNAGFLRKNISNIEREKKVLPQARRHAGAQGIHLLEGDLKTLTLPRDVRVALLDFTGQTSGGNIVGIQRIPISKEPSFVSINVLAQREEGDIQDAIRRASMDGDPNARAYIERAIEEVKTERGFSHPLTHAEAADHLGEMIGEAQRRAAKAYLQQKGIDERLRDIGMHKMIRSFGANDSTRWRFQRLIGNMPIDVIRKGYAVGKNEGISDEAATMFAISRITDDIINQSLATLIGMEATPQDRGERSNPLLANVMDMYRLQPPSKTVKKERWNVSDLTNLRDMTLNVTMNSTAVSKVEKLQYVSKISAKGTPYWTTMAVVETPEEQYNSMRESAGFMLHCARDVMQYCERTGNKSVPFQFGLCGRGDPGFHPNNSLEFVVDGRKTRTMHLRQMYTDMRAWIELNDAYPLMDLEQFLAVERKRIEDLL